MYIQCSGVFQAYLRAHDLDLLNAALLLRTRYWLLCDIAEGIAVAPWELNSILSGLSTLTRTSYEEWTVQYHLSTKGER